MSKIKVGKVLGRTIGSEVLGIRDQIRKDQVITVEVCFCEEEYAAREK